MSAAAVAAAAAAASRELYIFIKAHANRTPPPRRRSSFFRANTNARTRIVRCKGGRTVVMRWYKLCACFACPPTRSAVAAGDRVGRRKWRDQVAR